MPPPYPDDLITRARIANLRWPNCVIGGWAAARYAGLQFWVEDAPVTVLTAGHKRKNQDDLLFLDPRPNRSTSYPDPAFPNLRVADIHDATVDCLQILQKGRHTWWVPKIPGLTATEIRQVQLLDHLRERHLVDGKELGRASRSRFAETRLHKLGGLSDAGAQSPRETLLRLILREVPGLESQIKIFGPGGRLLTVADLAISELRVAIFYDGGHHLRRDQRDYDAKVWALLTQMGWRTFRATNGMLTDPDWLLTHVKQLVAEASADCATRASATLIRRRSS